MNEHRPWKSIACLLLFFGHKLNPTFIGIGGKIYKQCDRCGYMKRV